eukprot:4076619-Prymnesium_polylepis.1
MSVVARRMSPAEQSSRLAGSRCVLIPPHAACTLYALVLYEHQPSASAIATGEEVGGHVSCHQTLARRPRTVHWGRNNLLSLLLAGASHSFLHVELGFPPGNTDQASDGRSST